MASRNANTRFRILQCYSEDTILETKRIHVAVIRQIWFVGCIDWSLDCHVVKLNRRIFLDCRCTVTLFVRWFLSLSSHAVVRNAALGVDETICYREHITSAE